MVKYIKTTSTSLSDLPIVNGQIIALTDTDGLYYDLDNVRHVAGSGVSSSTLGDLSDVNLTSLAEGQVLQYDATAEEWINATIFGNETISYDDFLDLPQEEKDNGTAYYIPDAGWTGGGSGGGGGGTTVIANPSGTATADLEKLQVDSTIYAIPQGGSTYTAGDGIDITNDVISAAAMPSEDMAEIVTPLPGTMSRRMKYSTTEQIIGEWIDGKPLYQKTFTGTKTISTSESTLGASLDSACDIIDWKGAVVTNASNKRLYKFGYLNVAANVSGGSIISVFPENNVFYVRATASFTDATYWLTVQYTKTTDTANS